MRGNWKRRCRLLGSTYRKFLFLASCFLVLLLACCHLGGLFSMAAEKPFSEFEYPLEGNVTGWVNQLVLGKTLEEIPVPVVNPYHGIGFLFDASAKCSSPPRLVYLVKSAAGNFQRRTAIRNSWGFEKRFSDVRIATVFLIGLSSDPDVGFRIQVENNKHSDLVLADFLDNYYNNTYKTVLGLKWAYKYCPKAKFYFFVDDDMYVSTKNVLRYVRRPHDYPGYLKRPLSYIVEKSNETDFDENRDLYAGFLWSGTRPMRHTMSKWYISVSDYPYNGYPDFISAGAYVLSHASLLKLYYASLYVLPFRYDDVYLGILAYKIAMNLTYSTEFHFYKKYHQVFEYRYVIASHGYGDPVELLKVWNLQRSMGNA